MARQRPSSRRQIPLEETSRADSTLPASTSSVGATATTASSAVRITRSTARTAADSTQITSSRPPGSALAAGPAPATAPAPSRKRKAPARCDKSVDDQDPPITTSTPQRVKKQRRAAASQPSAAAPAAAAAPSHRAARNPSTMSQSSSSSRPVGESARTSAHSPSGRRKPSRGGKVAQDRPVATQSPPPCRPKKRSAKSNAEFMMKEAEEEAGTIGRKEEHDDSPPHDNDGSTRSAFDEEDLDQFHSSLFGSGGPMGLQSTLRALSGMMSGMSSRLQHILCDLRAKDDPSLQLIALQELSDLLLVSNEDTLTSDFSPEPYVRELVTLMQPNDMGEENPEIMLLACRCLANLMEAMGGSVSTVVMGGAVPVLCQKLLDIQFIDLAEQALSTLAKISVSFPASIVRAGGLTACLTYLDFFPTSTQRTAVTTAANCCRNLPHDSFAVVRDVMPTLLNVLASNDPKVVEQGCLCVSRIVESFRNRADKLEELIEPAMLTAVLRLLQAGTTNLVGPHTHTQFLRVLAITSRASPRLSMELLKMDVVDTLYQILTGVSPPADEENTVIKMDSVLVMQALIHRPREQVYEALNVICELLPGVPDSESQTDGLMARLFDNGLTHGVVTFKTAESMQKRRALLRDCKSKLKRFAMVLLPTLTDAYSSTVNLGVRQKVLIAQLKMLHNLETALIEDSLRSVPYASFLAAILSQQDHPSLVSLALRCAELLFRRLEHVYQRQFHREGVIAEVTKLAAGPLSSDNKKRRGSSPMHARNTSLRASHAARRVDNSSGQEDPTSEAELGSEPRDDASSEDFDHDEEDHEEDHDLDEEELSETDSSSSSSDDRGSTDSKEAWNDLVVRDARAFLKVYEASNGGNARAKASDILTELRSLAADIDACYRAGSGSGADGFGYFQKLASYFDGDALESITSSELLNSGIITTLSDIFGNFKETSMRAARAAFLQAFLGSAISQRAQSQSTATTPFSVLIQKLQALFSRTEHFEVLTVSHNSLENTRSNARNMLGKQLRLKLVAEDDSEIPRSYRNIMVSIHAIATFKALDDFLRPRISLSDRPRGSRGSRNRDAILSQLAKAAGLRDDLPGTSDNAELAGAAARAQPSSSADTPSLPNRSGRTGLDTWAAAQQSTPPGTLSSSGRPKASARRQTSGKDDDLGAEPLECADEKQLSDVEAEEDDEIDDEQDEELNATVDDLDDDLSDDNLQDPSAVNMEVALSGKVTARQEDGTRVATPLQSTPLSKAASSGLNPAATSTSGSLANAGRPFSSYAAAMASTPQDWHIVFSVEGQPVSNDTTVYRAVHHDREHLHEYNGRNVWSAVHTVTFKRVPGPPPPEPSTVVSALSESLRGDAPEMPSSLSKDATTASILRLLSILHQMNATLDDVVAEHKELMAITPEPLAQFINTKLTAKLNRQLEEPLIVASNCLPSWSEDLARLFPFLFPFETRHLFLQSTAFGYSRAMMRWQNSSSGNDSHRDLAGDDRPFLGRLQRQKVRISRTRILDSAMKVMELYGSSPSVLEVEYFEEVGTGLGPTLEFYSTVSKELSKKRLKIWRDHDSNAVDEYAFGKRGLFPAPMSDRLATTEHGKKQLHLFKILGKFVARSMLDSRIIDISFNPAFFRVANSSSTTPPSLGTVKAVDSGLANSLLLLKRFVDAKRRIDDNTRLSPAQKAQALLEVQIDGVKVEDLSLDFTLPGNPTIELIKDGSNVPVTIANVDIYIDRVVDLTLGSGVKRQIEAFRAGFSQVFPYTALRTFTPNELVMLFGRAEEDWSIETLMDSIKADHGFNMDSKSVRNLLQTMSELSKQQRRDFLQFVTGSPKLPIGGFKSLTPLFTVVCRPSEPPYTADDYLPSVMTCVNYLKLPDYSSLQVLRERLSVAIREGQGAFHLS